MVNPDTRFRAGKPGVILSEAAFAIGSPLLEARSSGSRRGKRNDCAYLRVADLRCCRMGVSVKTVRRRIADGILPVYRCGRILRLDPNDVDGMFCRYPQLTAAALGSTGRRPARRATRSAFSRPAWPPKVAIQRNGSGASPRAVQQSWGLARDGGRCSR